MWDASVFLGALTPKFYVALTGTSSLISGLILIFEWWYFRKYGISFIEQVSVGHLGSWLSGSSGKSTVGSVGAGASGGGVEETPKDDSESECRVCRNPMSLLRGAEYARLWTAARRSPLTYYDMNLSAQDHQAWFAPPSPPATPADEALSRAWREREPRARVAAARQALRLAPRDPAALLLLAEEDAPTVAEAERVLRQAWRAAEGAVRAGGGARDVCLLAHVKRRTAMCLRRLGRLRDAARMFRDLTRECPPALRPLAPHENLIEVLLEQRAYPEASAALARAVDAGAPRSACLMYTAALLSARAAAPDAADALRAAIRYNPHVPPLLLERRALSLPPEHVVRRGESEAFAYSFWHLRHWRAPSAEPAAQLLAAAWRAWGPAELAAARTTAACFERADRDLVAGSGALYRPGGYLLPAGAAMCALCAFCALAAHGWSLHVHAAARAALRHWHRPASVES